MTRVAPRFKSNLPKWLGWIGIAPRFKSRQMKKERMFLQAGQLLDQSKTFY